MNITDIEKRFLEIAGYTCDLTNFSLHIDDCPQVKNDKDKSDLHGEVFTPLWMVDKMILKSPDSLKDAENTLDLCSGYGQFTVRMLRFLINNTENFDKEYWLKEIHSFNEYQLSSACKLLYIFGTDINLFIGDAQKLPQLKDTDYGVLLYSKEAKKWSKITEDIKEIFVNVNKYSKELENTFIEKLNKMEEVIKKERSPILWWNMK